jgi:hypothetical protein
VIDAGLDETDRALLDAGVEVIDKIDELVLHNEPCFIGRVISGAVSYPLYVKEYRPSTQDYFNLDVYASPFSYISIQAQFEGRVGTFNFNCREDEGVSRVELFGELQPLSAI